MDTGYVFDNAVTSPARTRMTCLETLYDPVTQANLTATGVGPGWDCLEAGAGGGSIARWLASRVTPGGRVLATDLHPGLCEPGPGVEVLEHDITRGPLPWGPFNLIHARLLLCHLPQREQVLRRLTAALAPGGWLVIEDFDNLLLPPVLGDSPAEQLIAKYSRALCAVLTSRGADPGWARRLPALLTTAGLASVHAAGQVVFSPGGSPGAVLQQANVEQTRELLTGTGLITGPDTRDLCGVLTDPSVTFLQPTMITVRGQVPHV